MTTGNETFELPVPATHIVDPSGRIVHHFVNTDYTQRADPERIVEVLQGMLTAV